MYLEFFNLREMPFSITPDPAYLFLSQRHQEALGHLLYGTGQHGGFVQLTGEVGTGKTTVVRTLLEQKLADVDVAMIHNPRQGEAEFVRSIADELAAPYPPSATLKEVVDALNEHLLKAHAAGRRTVLIIDEAQNLEVGVLEQVRLLTNLETAKQKLLRIMLIGQPELAELLARPDLRQLAQRITARYHLMPLDAGETAEYIRHRLRIAGTQEELFPPAAVHEVHRQARGVPRLINIICDRALLGAYSQGLRRLTPEVIRRAALEAVGPSSGFSRTDLPHLPAAAQGLPARLQKLGERLRRRLPPGWVPVSALEWGLSVLAVLIAGALVYRTFFEAPPAPVLAAATPARSVAPPATIPVAPPAAPAGAPAEAAPAYAAPAPATPVVAAVTEPAVTLPATRPEPQRAAAPPPPAATRPAPSGPLPAGLGDLLASTQPLSQVMSRLIRLWDSELVVPRGQNVCKALAQSGLECYKANGEWKDLRQMNRPAILSLSNGRGDLQHVLLRGLSSRFATVDTASGSLVVAIEELDVLWTGEFLLLWRRGTPETFIGPAASGSSVQWLRRRLAEVEGRSPEEPLSASFDARLRDQLRSFQAAQGLDADGLAGIRTLISLGTAEGPTPTLSGTAP
ncbi:MAG TPA: AAA family ATPase [Nevskiaceae bacterium]|nr:AAA family ATPase [Nevskiaceae bacterium]